jgi:hypothetical protein
MTTKSLTYSLIAVLALGTFSAFAPDDKKADASGTWTWTTPGRDGGEGRKSTMKLKVEGEKVTGSIATPGREGQVRETPITNGKVKGDQITFDVTREFQGNKFTAKYSGKLAGDTITGKMETERDGNTRERPWEAKRETAKK